jgi:hypothetical protein
MATVVTYVLVSDPQDPHAVRSHPAIDAHGLEPQPIDEQPIDEQSIGEQSIGEQSIGEKEGEHESRQRAAGDVRAALRFSVARPLEDHERLDAPCRDLSSAFPEATVILYEVEERFDQIEHLRSVVFVGGRRAGHIEHGSIFSVGT